VGEFSERIGEAFVELGVKGSVKPGLDAAVRQTEQAQRRMAQATVQGGELGARHMRELAGKLGASPAEAASLLGLPAAGGGGGARRSMITVGSTRPEPARRGEKPSRGSGRASGPYNASKGHP
jgi:hypothetical protein